MKKQPVTQKDLLFLVISSSIVTAAWIGFNLYHIQVSTTVDPKIQRQLSPISSTFDTATLDAIRERTNVVPVDAIAQPTIPEPTATESAELGISGQ